MAADGTAREQRLDRPAPARADRRDEDVRARPARQVRLGHVRRTGQRAAGHRAPGEALQPQRARGRSRDRRVPPHACEEGADRDEPERPTTVKTASPAQPALAQPAAVQRQISLPLSKATEIAYKSIRLRLSRSLLVTSGIVLALAFLMSILTSDAILASMRGWIATTDDSLRAQQLSAMMTAKGASVTDT